MPPWVSMQNYVIPAAVGENLAHIGGQRKIERFVVTISPNADVAIAGKPDRSLLIFAEA